jgi:nucleoside-diphosphate-sugar epimerase
MGKIVITGTNGYLGHFVARHFESMNQQVVRLNRIDAKDLVSRNFYDVRHIKGSSNKSLILTGFPSDPITASNYEEIISKTVCGALNLGLLLSDFGLERVIIMGSYWQEPDGQAYYPLNYYATCKQLLEIAMSALVLKGIDVYVLHLGDVYGPKDSRQKLIPELIRNRKEKKHFYLRSPESRISPIWVSDVVGAIEALLQLEKNERAEYKTYSCLGEYTYSVIEVVNLFEKTFGKIHGEITIADVRDKKLPIVAAESRHPRPPHWIPKVTLEQGLNYLKISEFDYLTS